MKGILIKKDKKWFVQYDIMFGDSRTTDELPLHPDNVAAIEDIEERLEINEYPDGQEVNFDVEEGWVINSISKKRKGVDRNIVRYAKIKK